MEKAKPEVVVVTGASAGVGRATVREFTRRGAQQIAAEIKWPDGGALVLEE